MIEQQVWLQVPSGIEITAGVLVPRPSMLTQYRVSILDRCESAWRTANTGSNPVGAVSASGGWPRRELGRSGRGLLPHESRSGLTNLDRYAIATTSTSTLRGEQ